MYAILKALIPTIMTALDNRAHLKNIDRHNYLNHLLEVPEQITDGYDLGMGTILPALYAQAKQVVILAAGESKPIAHLIQELALGYSRVPVMVVDDYYLPAFVTSDTLVIALDYAGSNEQVIMAFQEAAKRKARLLAISIEGKLASEARRVRALHISLQYGAPARLAFYYMMSVLIAIFKKIDMIEVKDAMMVETAVLCRSLMQNIGPEIPQFQNNAKQLAEKVLHAKTVIVGSGALAPMSDRWWAMFGSTAKLLGCSSTLSEFSDTIMNGLRPMAKGIEPTLVIMLQSKYDHARNKTQQTLVYQVAQAQKVPYEQIFMHPSGSLIGEIMLSALLGDMVSYYVALLTGIDPTPIEATVYLRDQLAHQD